MSSTSPTRHSARTGSVVPMYSSSMAVIASPIAMYSTFPASLSILMVIAELIALLAAGYFIGREYVNNRLNRRNWK